ncbi:VirK/YbjX family protein [Telluria mixta]|uniref:VirK/YbjX family protein n=1 Tax=Telluria mixta TaxID=34071 RepID=A0ABT2BTE0_9BURK|nr:VirK/YbjX family protein [Telluria mixta]MCS0628392.1 VirK/YbjX family protein [Telluria mixta]WEM93500.1 VirK/YbjX family protein [Telluria mixta]
MIFAHLTKHWMARRRQHSLSSWVLCIARSLRVLAYYRDHRALCQLGVYRNHVAKDASEDLFHHLSHRDYLIKGLSPRQRVQAVLSHYRFEETTFNDGYLDAVYGQRGLPLWHHQDDGSTFMIQLEMASRSNAEGDLTLALIADGKCLHRLSFSWLEGDMVGVDMPVVAFIARNQGRWIDSGAAFEAFERVFPNNSPSFFCFAAMQGIALALGMDKVVAIRSDAHIAYDPDPEKHFANAYDGFWKILGGEEMPGRDGYLIPLPFYVKPLSEMPSKHRKRAALRREHWRLIGDASRAVIQRHLLHARAHVVHPAAVPEPA